MFFGVRSIFISPNEHKKLAVFSRVAKPRVKIPLLVFNQKSITPKKNNTTTHFLFLLC